MNKAFQIFFKNKKDDKSYGGRESGWMLEWGGKKVLNHGFSTNNKSYLKPQQPGKKY